MLSHSWRKHISQFIFPIKNKFFLRISRWIKIVQVFPDHQNIIWKSFKPSVPNHKRWKRTVSKDTLNTSGCNKEISLHGLKKTYFINLKNILFLSTLYPTFSLYPFILAKLVYEVICSKRLFLFLLESLKCISLVRFLLEDLRQWSNAYSGHWGSYSNRKWMSWWTKSWLF